jgi:hypothetical protein
MGLDAAVYCNCFETGRLKEPPPCPTLVSVARNGCLECRSDDLETLLAFDQWVMNRACEHENGILLGRYIGNMARVALLRDELEREAEKFPVSLEKVLYSGTHTGDYLPLDDVRDLQVELNRLDGFICSSGKKQEYIKEFRRQMRELMEAALDVNKPISF